MIHLSRRTLLRATLAAALAVPVFAGAQAADKLTIMTSVPSLEFPFFVHMMKALKGEADKLGDITVWRQRNYNVSATNYYLLTA